MISNQKFTKSDGKSDWKDWILELGFGQVFEDWGRSDQLKLVLPHEVTRFVIRNIVHSANRSCSFGLNGSDLEQMSHN